MAELERNKLKGTVLGKGDFNPYTDVQPIISVDWDGTILLGPNDIDFGLLKWLKECQQYGAYIILYTCRRADGAELVGYLKYLKERGYWFDAVNNSHPRLIEVYGYAPNSKIFAHWYIDDQAVRWSYSKMNYSVWRVEILNKVKDYARGGKDWYYKGV